MAVGDSGSFVVGLFGRSRTAAGRARNLSFAEIVACAKPQIVDKIIAEIPKFKIELKANKYSDLPAVGIMLYGLGSVLNRD